MIVPLLIAGGVIGGLFLAASGNLTEIALARSLPKAGRPFAAAIIAAAEKHRINAWVLAGLISRESQFGALLEPKGPAGKGDAGHGHGLAQIDDRTWGTWLRTHTWWDPAVNIDKGAEILATALRTFGGDYTKALAAYNSGPRNVAKAIAAGQHPDHFTTGKDYGTDVLRRAAELEKKGVA